MPHHPDGSSGMLAVVPVRDGALPIGALEIVAECNGSCLLAGSAPDAEALAGVASDVRTIELGPFQPARWAATLAPHVVDTPVIVLPGSPDGRDLAPRLAGTLGRALLAGAVTVTRDHADVAREGGVAIHEFAIDEPVVVTLEPGVRGVLPDPERRITVARLEPYDTASAVVEPDLEELVAPDVATMDLSEAERVVGGGAGLDTSGRFDQLRAVAAAIGAVIGATRVITDRGWVDHRRQIGTTGVTVDPALYLAFGISGAVQHTAGLGAPEHVISVNTDPHCPMMQMADLAVVADANAVLDALEQLLERTGD